MKGTRDWESESRGAKNKADAKADFRFIDCQQCRESLKVLCFVCSCFPSTSPPAPRGLHLSTPLHSTLHSKSTMNTIMMAVLGLAAPIATTHASSYVDGGQDIACWRAKVMVACDTVFPNVDITVDWTPLEGRLIEGEVINIPSLLILPASLNISTQLFKAHEYTIDHTNIHACLTNGGFCSVCSETSPFPNTFPSTSPSYCRRI